MKYFTSRHACLFAALITALPSCKNAKEGVISTGSPILINLDSSAEYYSIADYVDDLHLIRLDTVDGAIISDAWNIQRVIHINGKYILLDGSYMSVKAFDSCGKYLNSFGSLGVRQGQFTRVDDIEYYPSDNSLMVLCNSPKKLAEFTLEGQLLKDSKLDFWATSVAFPSADSRIYYVNQNKSDVSGDKNILFTDSLNLVRGTLFNMPKNVTTVVKFSGNLTSNDGTVYFSPALSNTYYAIAGDTATPVFKINYGPQTVPPDIAQAKWMVNLHKYKFTYQTFIKNKDYLGVNFHSDGVGAAFYNLHSGNIITNDPQLDSLNMLFSSLMYQDHEKYIMVVDLPKLSSFVQRNLKKIQQKFPALYSQLIFQRAYKSPGLLTFTLKPV